MELDLDGRVKVSAGLRDDRVAPRLDPGRSTQVRPNHHTSDATSSGVMRNVNHFAPELLDGVHVVTRLDFYDDRQRSPVVRAEDEFWFGVMDPGNHRRDRRPEACRLKRLGLYR